MLFNKVLCTYRSSHPDVFLGECVLKICSKFTREHPCRSVISIKSHSSFFEITLWHGCSPVNLLFILRTIFPKNTSGWLLLHLIHLHPRHKSNTKIAIITATILFLISLRQPFLRSTLLSLDFSFSLIVL